MSFHLPSQTSGTQHPHQTTISRPSDAAGQQSSTQGVSGVLPDLSQSDAERELRIALAGSMVEHHMGEWAAHSNFDDRAKAALALRRVEALVQARSPEQVLRLEIARGLI